MIYIALSEKKRISNDRWIKENYKQVKLSMPNKEAEALEAHCAKFNYSKAGFIRQAIKDKMQRDQAASGSAEGVEAGTE